VNRTSYLASARTTKREPRPLMFRDRFEEATILGTGPDGLTRVITRKSWAERESVLVEAGRPS
jgi:hypothetical protein